MALALYRKYRPQNFSQLIGQNHIKTTLKSEIELGKIAHAYLFSGPRGLGKTTTARLMAKAVNCLKRQPGEAEPCNDCQPCRDITTGNTLDVMEVDAASNTGVDNVRENIINSSRFTPSSLKYKVFIIDEVHMLSISAFNALLKTLEEPPAHVIFILATTEIHKVPETIISRCQHFDFRKVTYSELLQRLIDITSQEGKRCDSSVLENIARHAQGSVRDAESLLGQILSLGEKEITAEQAELVLPRSQYELATEFIGALLKKDAVLALTLIHQLVDDGVDLEKFSADLIELLRLMLLVKINVRLGDYSQVASPELLKQLGGLAQQASAADLMSMIDTIIVRRQELKFADISQLPLELAALEIIDGKSGTNIADDRQDLPPPTASSSSSATTSSAKNLKQSQSADVKPPSKRQIASTIHIDMIIDKWHDILDSMRKHNASLASALKIGQPVAVDDEGDLVIAFPHKFQQQRVIDPKNRQLVERILADILQMPVLIKTTVAERLTPIEPITSEQPANGLNQILENFGGQIID